MNDARRLLGIQAALVAAAGAGSFVLAGGFAARSALYGGAIALLAAWMLQRRVRRAIEVARDAPGGETTVLYVGALQRFLAMLGLFALGLGWLGLSPLPLLVGFAVAQLAYFLHRPGAVQRTIG